MATTALFVEILIIGAISEIWILSVIFFLFMPNFNFLYDFLKNISVLTPYLVIIYFASTYCIGWIVNFICEKSMKPFFQKKYRDNLFSDFGKCYYETRSYFFQHASTHLISDLRFDRHIIRISRSNIFNFLLISLSSLLHSFEDLKISLFCFFFSIIICAISFFQWRTRYQSCYTKLIDNYKTLNSIERK